MADPHYNEGITEVTPSSEATPYQSAAGADPEAFGAGIAQGVQKVGQGAEVAGKFFGKVAADNASNDYQDFATKLLHGDPNATGADGQPDTGYLGLKGRAALDARPDIQAKLDARAKELQATLQTPEQQQEFENFSRRYRTGATEKIGSHADTQASSWYTAVNTATAKLSMDHIANNFDSPDDVAHGTEDLIHAYVKNAQIAGAQDGDPQFTEAIASAKRDALQARLNAMAVKDPSRALAILDKEKATAGVQYDNLANTFRARADAQRGDDIAEQAYKKTYSAPSATGYTPASLTEIGAPYGVSGSYLQRVHQIEGNGTSGTGAQGPFQFIPSTAKQYGLKDPFNPAAAADAAARLAADNKAALSRMLGRAPTDPELYLAHQQGSGGAAALLANPTLSARDALMTTTKYRDDPAAAARAIRVNGGNPDAPASAFTGMWAAKYTNAPTEINESKKAAAYQEILAIPATEISEPVRQRALTKVNQMVTASTVAEEQDAKAKKTASDQLQGKIFSDIVKGAGPDVIGQIATAAESGQLSRTDAEALYNFAVNKGGIDDPLSNGPGYTDAMKRITLPPDDPARLTSHTEIVQLANSGALTKKGADRVKSDLEFIGKNPDQSGITTTKSHMLSYYETQFAPKPEFPGLPRNQKGLDIYNRDFVPALEAAYGKWVGDKKDPMAFWTNTKELDAIMNRVYPPSQRNMDLLNASGDVAPTAGPPPAPAGTDPKPWDRIIAAPPMQADGKTPWAPAKWATAVTRLRENASDPRYINGFNKTFGPSGYTAEDILKRLPPTPRAAPVAAPVVPPAAAPQPRAVEPPEGIKKLQTDHVIPPPQRNPGPPDNKNPLNLSDIPAVGGIRG